MSVSRSFFEKYALQGLVVSIVIIIALFGYHLSRNVMMQKERHQAILMHLNTLQLLNQKIDTYFSYEFQHVNYDEMVVSIKKFKQELATLKGLTERFESDSDTQAISAQLDRVTTLSAKRDIYLEKHKSYKSVAINSMRYLPGLYSDLKRFLLESNLPEALKNRVSGSSADTLTYIFYSLFKDAESESRLNENIEALEALYGHGKRLDRFLYFIILHSKNIEKQKQNIDRNIAKKRALGVGAAVERLDLRYLEYLDNSYAAKKRLNMILYGVVIVLFIALMIILYFEQKFKRALENLNDTLEDRIKEETRKRIDNEQILMQQSKLNAMGELITSISHQWRQPLNALGIIIQDIEDAYDFKELDKAYIEHTIEHSMEHINSMSRTIDEFRSFFKRSDTKVAIDVIKSLEYAVQMLSYRIEECGIGLNISYDESEVFTVMGLRSEFEQMMMILINNAIDAIDNARRSKGLSEQGVIDIAVTRNDHIRIEVGDNGIGIDPAIADRIFEPYYTTKDQGEGVGMGLYIAKLVLENHMNGSIRYVPGEKTKFVITMERI